MEGLDGGGDEGGGNEGGAGGDGEGLSTGAGPSPPPSSLEQLE